MVKKDSYAPTQREIDIAVEMVEDVLGGYNFEYDSMFISLNNAVCILTGKQDELLEDDEDVDYEDD